MSKMLPWEILMFSESQTAPLRPLPAVVPVERLASALAVLLVDTLAVLPGHKGLATRERLANRLFDRGVTPGGNEAAALLGAVATTMMRFE